MGLTVNISNALTLQPFVKYIAGKIATRVPPNVSLDELISAGNLGLMDAIDKFKPKKHKVKFKTYAEFRIKGAIIDELRKMDFLSRRSRNKVNLIEKTVETIEKRLKRPAKYSDIAQELEIELEAYYKLCIKIQGHKMLKFDQPIQNDQTPLYWLEKKEKYQSLYDAIKSLSWRTKEIIWLYFWQGYSLKKIGNVFDRTEGWACFELKKARGIIEKQLNEQHKGKYNDE